MVSEAVKLSKVEAGRKGGRTRWDKDAADRGAPTGPRVLRLDELDPDTRRVVLAIVQAQANADRAEK